MKIDKFKAVEEWVTAAALVFGISHWEITISREFADPDADADIEVSPQRSYAEMRLQKDFFSYDPEKQRVTLCHELGHIVNAGTDRVVENLEDTLGKIGWATFEPNYLDATERATDHWARIVAPLLPLPQFPKS